MQPPNNNRDDQEPEVPPPPYGTQYTPHAAEHEAFAGDTVRLSTQNQGVQLPRHRTINFGTGLTATEDQANKRITVTNNNPTPPSAIPVFSGARVYHNAHQSISATDFTYLAFNSERFDTSSYHDTSTNNSRLTAPTTGYYLIGGSVQIEFNYGMGIGLRINGTTLIAQQFDGWYAAAATYLPIWQFTISSMYAMTAGDYVEFGARALSAGHNAEASSVFGSGNFSPEFWITRLGS